MSEQQADKTRDTDELVNKILNLDSDQLTRLRAFLKEMETEEMKKKEKLMEKKAEEKNRQNTSKKKPKKEWFVYKHEESDYYIDENGPRIMRIILSHREKQDLNRKISFIGSFQDSKISSNEPSVKSSSVLEKSLLNESPIQSRSLLEGSWSNEPPVQSSSVLEESVWGVSAEQSGSELDEPEETDKGSPTEENSLNLMFKDWEKNFLLDYAAYCAINYEETVNKEAAMERMENENSPWQRYNILSLTCLVEGPTDKGVAEESAKIVTDTQPSLMGENFIIWLMDKYKDIMKDLRKYPNKVDKNELSHTQKLEPGIIDAAAETESKKNANCSICRKEIDPQEPDIVVHHNHRTNEVYGPAHGTCNKKAQVHRFLPIFVHCKNPDDFRGLLITLFNETVVEETRIDKVTFSSVTFESRCETEEIPASSYTVEVRIKNKNVHRFRFLNANHFLIKETFEHKIDRLLGSISALDISSGHPHATIESKESLKSEMKRVIASLTSPSSERDAEKIFEIIETLSEIRKFYFENFYLDYYCYTSLDNFTWDVITSTTKVSIKYNYLDLDLVPYMGDSVEFWSNCFEQGWNGKKSTFLQAMRLARLPISDLKKITDDSEFEGLSDPQKIAGLPDNSDYGFVYQIHYHDEAHYHIHYILLKLLLREKKIQIDGENTRITLVIKFKQKAFMRPLAEWYEGAKGCAGRLKEQFFKNLSNYLAEVKQKSTRVCKVEKSREKSSKKSRRANLTDTTNPLGDSFVEVISAKGYQEGKGPAQKKQTRPILNLAFRDIVYAFSQGYKLQK